MFKIIASSALLLALVGIAPAHATDVASADVSEKDGGAVKEVSVGKDTSVLKVTIDQAKIERVPAGTATLVIGNPMIADVSMLKGGAANGCHRQGLRPNEPYRTRRRR